MNRRAYLFVYSDVMGTRDRVREIVNSIDEILNWRYELPNSFYLVAEAPIKGIAEKIREKSGGKGAFIITEIASNKWGWLDKQSWKLINQKHLPE